MKTYDSLLDAFKALNDRKRWQPENMTASDWAEWKQLRCAIESELFHQERDPARDSREHLRVPVTLEARYWSRNELKDRYISVLGEGGLFISTVDLLPVGSCLDLELCVAEKELVLKIQGQVVWIGEDEDPARQGMGIQFVDMTYQQKQVIYSLVDDSLRQHLLERRRFGRIHARLEVEFALGEDIVQAHTRDIGLGGVFVASDKLFPVGERVRLVLHVPGSKPAIRAQAEVVRAVERGHAGRPRGMGMRFLELAPGNQASLREYLGLRVTGGIGPCGHERERRLHTRVQRRVKLRFRAPETLAVTFTQDISIGGAFILTHEPPPPGTRVEISLVHPVTLQELGLSGRIVRAVPFDPARPDQIPGAGVVFDAPDEDRQPALLQFLRDCAVLETVEIPGLE